MTFSQKYEENILAGEFDEHLFRIKLSKAIVALRTSSFKAYNEVMEFLEKDCSDAINEIYRLNNLVESNDKYYEDEIDRITRDNDDLQDEILNLKNVIDDMEDQY